MRAVTRRAAGGGTLFNLTCFCRAALLRPVLDSSRVGEDPGGHHRRGVRLRRAVRGPAANLLLLSSAR